MMGTPEAYADGDGKPNSEEGIYVNLSTPRPTHTDPTPLWMTDSTSRGKARYTPQYYQMDPDAEVPDFMTGAYPWSWNSSNGSVHEKGQFWMFSFEENEGYDTDHDGLNDLTEGTTTATVASDPLVFSDPDRRQALWFPGANSAAVSYNSTFRREVELEYSLLKRFTVEAWICPEVVTRDQVILERTVNCSPNTLSNNVTKIRANFRIGLMADGRLYGQFDTMDAIATGSGDSSPTVVSTFAQTANKWSHVALSYDGVVLTLYVDGQVAGTFQTSLAPANGILVLAQDAVPGNAYFPVLGRGYDVLPAAVVLGARAIGANGVELSEKTTWSDFDSFYQGYLDEVRVWDDVRTSAQILTSMKQRLTFDDVKALRDEIFESWYDAATRNDNDGYPNLPAELVLHYNFQTLYGAVNETDVTREPVGFKKNVIDNVRVDGGYVPGGLECGWWAALQDTVGSTVYDNYHVVPASRMRRSSSPRWAWTPRRRSRRSSSRMRRTRIRTTTTAATARTAGTRSACCPSWIAPLPRSIGSGASRCAPASSAARISCRWAARSRSAPPRCGTATAPRPPGSSPAGTTTRTASPTGGRRSPCPDTARWPTSSGIPRSTTTARRSRRARPTCATSRPACCRTERSSEATARRRTRTTTACPTGGRTSTA